MECKKINKKIVIFTALMGLLLAESSANQGEEVPIDLIFELYTMDSYLDSWFSDQYTGNQRLRFAHVRNEYDSKLGVLCNKFEILTKKTGSKESEYYDELEACYEYKKLLLNVLQKVNQYKFKDIPKLRKEYQPEYENLEKQIKEEREKTKGMSIDELLRNNGL